MAAASARPASGQVSQQHVKQGRTGNEHAMCAARDSRRMGMGMAGDCRQGGKGSREGINPRGMGAA